MVIPHGGHEVDFVPAVLLASGYRFAIRRRGRFVGVDGLAVAPKSPGVAPWATARASTTSRSLGYGEDSEVRPARSGRRADRGYPPPGLTAERRVLRAAQSELRGNHLFWGIAIRSAVW
jgi:hypothetical protein